jgi:hypothetical protein
VVFAPNKSLPGKSVPAKPLKFNVLRQFEKSVIGICWFARMFKFEAVAAFKSLYEVKVLLSFFDGFGLQVLFYLPIQIGIQYHLGKPNHLERMLVVHHHQKLLAFEV